MRGQPIGNRQKLIEPGATGLDSETRDAQPPSRSVAKG